MGELIILTNLYFFKMLSDYGGTRLHTSCLLKIWTTGAYKSPAVIVTCYETLTGYKGTTFPLCTHLLNVPFIFLYSSSFHPRLGPAFVMETVSVNTKQAGT